MSSGDDSLSDAGKASKPNKNKRRAPRIQRSCDVCRRKKIKCDWAATPGSKCTFCRTQQLACEHTHGIRENKLDTAMDNIEPLKNCIKKMAAWVCKRHPEVDLVREFDVPEAIVQWVEEQSLGAPFLRDKITGEVVSINLGPGGENNQDESELSEDEVFKLSELQPRSVNMNLGARFLGKGSVLGKSSGIALFRQALDLRLNSDTPNALSHREMRSKRNKYWNLHQFQWEKAKVDERLFEFPPDDLMYSLIDIYFGLLPPHTPLFHRPSFMRNMAQSVHLRDPAFATIVLLVCAIASKFSEDKRVLLTDSWFSAGWKWYKQARLYYTPLIPSPSLQDVQIQTLICLYLDTSSTPQTTWSMCGFALRLAMDVGAHTRKAYQATPNIDDELWKRVFWVLVLMDRRTSARMGRCSAVQNEDIDLDLPIDCNEEYWEHSDPKQAFKQPPGKPSRTSFFIALIKLNKILGVATRTLFTLNPRENVLLEATGKDWQQKIVTALDSALNAWISSLPDHLKWDPRPTDRTFLLQSGILHTYHLELQIMIHRAFIPQPNKPPQTTFPSLAICTNAARSCIQIVSVGCRSVPHLYNYMFQISAFQAAVVLIFSIWSAKRTGRSIDVTKDMDYVWECMQVLKHAEARFVVAGKLWDVLSELVFLGDLPLPMASSSSNISPDGSLSTIESSPVSASSSSALGLDSPLNYSLPLPISSQELGQLPLYTSLASVDVPTMEMSPFAPAPYLASGASSMAGATTSMNMADLDMDAVMAAFGFGTPVDGPDVQPENNSPPAADLKSSWPQSADFSFTSDANDWNGWISSLLAADISDQNSGSSGFDPDNLSLFDSLEGLF